MKYEIRIIGTNNILVRIIEFRSKVITLRIEKGILQWYINAGALYT